jgi:hypothetical protein
MGRLIHIKKCQPEYQLSLLTLRIRLGKVKHEFPGEVTDDDRQGRQPLSNDNRNVRS